MLDADTNSMGPTLYYLRRGEPLKYIGRTGREYMLGLVDYSSAFEPLYVGPVQYAIFTSAEVEIQIDSARLNLRCRPYELPTPFEGIGLQVDLVREVCGGAKPEPLGEAAIRLAVYEEEFFSSETAIPLFPLDGYRRCATNCSRSWNEFVSVHERDGEIYYHRGEDFGAVPNRLPYHVVSAGVLSVYPGIEGDGNSNVVVTRTDSGEWKYAHTNEETFNPEQSVGMSLPRGHRIGLTGNSWNGIRVEDPHLHLDLRRAGGCLNTYPLLAAAFRRRFSGEVSAFAGGQRFCLEGDRLTLEADCADHFAGGEPSTFHWRFCDGGEAHGARVEKRYPAAGVYMEECIRTGADGRIEYDYVVVRVSRPGLRLPYLYFNIYPMRDIRCDTLVEFRFSVKEMKNVVIDFGDGERSPVRPRLEHRYREPGDYPVVVYGNGTVPGIFRTRVIVE